MKRIKAVIIAFDGLDHSLVDEFSFEGLKQFEYGKVDLKSFPIIATPLIWPSFITGLTPDVHKITGFANWDFNALNSVRDILIRLNLYEEQGSPWWVDKIASVLGSLGFRSRVYSKRDLDKRGIRTIFDCFDNSFAIDIPSYNEPPIYQTFRSEIKKCFEDPRFEKSYEKTIWDYCQKKLDLCLRLLDGNWRLFMVHFSFTDQLGHLWRGDLAKMFGIYSRAANIAKMLKNKVSESTLFIIASDHGMNPKGRYGLHSLNGFYSSNKPLGLENPEIIDFAPLILRKLATNGSQTCM